MITGVAFTSNIIESKTTKSAKYFFGKIFPL